jgi:hypothetical protein
MRSAFAAAASDFFLAFIECLALQRRVMNPQFDNAQHFVLVPETRVMDA